MSNIESVLLRSMGMKPGRVEISVNDGMLICTANPNDATKVYDALDTLIREVDLTGTKAGSVTILNPDKGVDPNPKISYAVKVDNLHKAYQEMCGVNVNGRAHE